jgi:beta-galactosidase
MDECAASCCLDYSCGLWQWQDPATNPTGGGGCWVGPGDCAQNVSNPLWTSFVRTGPPPGPPPPSAAPCTDASQPCAKDFDDSAWRALNVPHDFIVEGVANPACDRGHGYLCFNKSWYRKTFTVDPAAQGKLVWLDFDGVYKNSQMWLNGAYLGHFVSGYVSFRYYLHNATFPNSTAPVLNYGAPNVLSVLVDALTEQEGWFYEGGGITRHTWLNTADPLSIPPWGAFFPASVTGAITSGPLGAMGPQTAASALILAQVDVQNARAAPAELTLAITVTDAGGATVAASNTSKALPAGGWARLTPAIPIAATVSLWNTESTAMYSVRADVIDSGAGGGAVVDSVSVAIGIRDAVWTPNQGFMLNGFKVPAKGFSQHQDFAGTGTAVPDRVNEFRVQGIRDIGGNFWRTAHNPTNPELLDFADRHGMLMWVENRFINKGVQPIQSAKDTPQAFPPFNAAADPGLLADAQAMVLRDRNHPSVVIWSLCNEGGCQIGAPAGASIGAQFKNVINYADTTRPITANGEWSIGTSDTLTNVMDVVTCSYGYAEYTQFHYTRAFARACKNGRAPWRPTLFHAPRANTPLTPSDPYKAIMGGESASCTSDRGYYMPTNATAGHMNSDDDGCVISAWASAAENPWDSGNFVWTGHDCE